MFGAPITMADAEELGVPACFSEEYAYHERHGTLPPYSGPVYPDHNREDYDYPCEEPEPPQPCQGPPPAFVVLGMPERWRAHEPGCWDLHAPDTDGCPPPF